TTDLVSVFHSTPCSMNLNCEDAQFTKSRLRLPARRNQPRRNEEHEERSEKHLRALRFFIVDFHSFPLRRSLLNERLFNKGFDRLLELCCPNRHWKLYFDLVRHI